MTNKNNILRVAGVIIILLLAFLAFKSYKDAKQGPIDGPIIVMPVEPTVPEPVITPPVKSSAEFNKALALKVNEKATYPDGLVVTLKEINDSRCKPGVQCIWAGELSPLLVLSGGKLKVESVEVRLGTDRTKTATAADYTLTLVGATETSATITITSKNSVAVGKCYVGGCSGQICSDQEGIASTCEYRSEYACYKSAECKRQASGQCGWTQTPELAACLSNGGNASLQ